MQAPPPFSLTTTEGWLVASGEIDMLTAPRLAAALAANGYDGIDLAGVAFIDVSGLRVLLSEARSASAEGRRFVVANPSPMIRRLLALTAIDHSVHVVFTA